MFKVVYIDYNFIDKRYPNSLNDGDAFYTYGFGSIYARMFKKYNPEIEVECWKADSRIKDVYEKNIQNVKYIIFPSIKFGKLGHYSSKLIQHLKKEISNNSNVIFNISSIRHLLFYSLAIYLKKNPLVVQHHGEGSAIYKTKINRGFRKLFYAFQIPCEKIAFKNVNVFFALDKRIKHYLPKGNNIKIEVSTTGVDENIFYPLDKIEAKKLLGWNVSKKHILYVGRLNYTKRPDILIDIFDEFIKEGRIDVELVLAGCEKNDPLYDKAKKSGAKIYGKILQTELYKYLSAADVYVLPLLSNNIPFGGIGMLSVQALFCNTPIVGSTVKLFHNNGDRIGITADDYGTIKSALQDVIAMKVRFHDLRSIALKNYSWECISKSTAEKYLQLIR